MHAWTNVVLSTVNQNSQDGRAMDLSKLTDGDLRSLEAQIKEELKKRERHEIEKAREQILEIARRTGVPVKQLVGSKNVKRGAVAVKFRHPDLPSQQWTGRGRQPKWIVEWVEQGKNIDALRV